MTSLPFAFGGCGGCAKAKKRVASKEFNRESSKRAKKILPEAKSVVGNAGEPEAKQKCRGKRTKAAAAKASLLRTD